MQKRPRAVLTFREQPILRPSRERTGFESNAACSLCRNYQLSTTCKNKQQQQATQKKFWKVMISHNVAMRLKGHEQAM